jgi:hypothetical protein
MNTSLTGPSAFGAPYGRSQSNGFAGTLNPRIGLIRRLDWRYDLRVGRQG